MINYNEFRTNKTAFTKAQNEKPVVLPAAAGYFVLGATAIYNVQIGDNYSVSCTCTAGRFGKFCYHAASALLAQLELEAPHAEAAAEYEQSEMDRLDLGHYVEDDVDCAIN
jgi:hypothetical protein